MARFAKMWQLLSNKPLDPLDSRTRHAIAMTPLLAWVGLGTDSLPSSCYGPEEAFLALGQHMPLALFLALATAATVFIIALGYNQVIELFPTDGSDYRVATALLGPGPGPISGAALLVDYILMVVTSLASGADAFFNPLPVSAQAFKLGTETVPAILMTGLSFRGMRGSILVLLPIFVGFVVLHLGLTIYGVTVYNQHLATVVSGVVGEIHGMSQTFGPLVIIGLLMRTFSMGGGTYTDLEVASNNVNTLAKPCVPTGKWTMVYMAVPLTFAASGTILLYMLWQAKPVEGQTLSAAVFGSVTDHMNLGSVSACSALLAAVLAFEAGPLLVGTQIGFLGGPVVLSNMAQGSWVPRHFHDLSTRLVRQNGIIVMDVVSVIILLWTHGQVVILVMFYNINIFLTFSLPLLDLCTYRWRRRRDDGSWYTHFGLSTPGPSVTSTVLVIMLVEKFMAGGRLTVVAISAMVTLCFLIRRYYDETRALVAREDVLFAGQPPVMGLATAPATPDPSQSTAILLVGEHRSASMHTLFWVNWLFPGHFKSAIFPAVGEVDTQSYKGVGHLDHLRQTIGASLGYYVVYCRRYGVAADYRIASDTHPIAGFTRLAEITMGVLPNSVCFVSKLIFKRVDFLTIWLRSRTPLETQIRLYMRDKQMALLSMNMGQVELMYGGV